MQPRARAGARRNRARTCDPARDPRPAGVSPGHPRKTAHDFAIRLVIPDRPGSHGSTPKPGRTIADWPADHLALMDTLGVDRFGIVTQSGGTPYGIAVAGAAPERVTAHSLPGA